MKRSAPSKPKTKVYGRYIVADPKVCHGKPTFKGTRVMVSQVLDQVASGLSWETICEEWDGRITVESIAEAVRLAREAFLTDWPSMAQSL